MRRFSVMVFVIVLAGCGGQPLTPEQAAALKDLGDGLTQAGESVRQADNQIQAQADRIQRTAPLPPPSPMPMLDTSSDYLPRRQSNLGIPEGPGYGAYVGTVPGAPNVYVIPPGAGP